MKIYRMVSQVESTLNDSSDAGTFGRKYSNIRSICRNYKIETNLLDIAFSSFMMGRGAAFSKKYLRRFIKQLQQRGYINVKGEKEIAQ